MEHEIVKLTESESLFEDSFIDAVISGQKLTAESMFKAAMSQKVTAALDARRVHIASTLYQRATENK